MTVTKHVDELISAYIDHELDETDRELVERHIQECSECKKLLDDLSSIPQWILTSYQALEPSDGMEDLIMHRIEETLEGKETRYGSGKFIPFLSITAIMMIFIPFLYFGGIITTVLHITLNLIGLLPIFINSIPILLVGIVLFSLVLLFLSIWSLRSLLGGGWIEKRT